MLTYLRRSFHWLLNRRMDARCPVCHAMRKQHAPTWPHNCPKLPFPRYLSEV